MEIQWKVHFVEIKFRIKPRSRKRSPLKRNMKDFSESKHFTLQVALKTKSEKRKLKGVDLFATSKKRSEKIKARQRFKATNALASADAS